MAKTLHRADLGWRQRRVFGALGLRPPVAEHSLAEAELLRRHATNASTIVEIGVSEGGSAVELRNAMDPSGTLFLVDPFFRGRLRFSTTRVTAKRAVKRESSGAKIRWLRSLSVEAAASWGGQLIDLLFI